MSERSVDINNYGSDHATGEVLKARHNILNFSDSNPERAFTGFHLRILARGTKERPLEGAAYGLALSDLIDEGHFVRDEKQMLIRQEPHVEFDLQ